MNELLKINNLTIWYGEDQNKNIIVENINFSLAQGETCGLIGKSGSGKSTIAWALTGMLPLFNGGCSGDILFSGKNLASCTEAEFQKFRWKKISIVPQAAMNCFNPIMTIGASIKEVIRTHVPIIGKKQLQLRCHDLMELAQLERTVLDCYPHQLSGGMKQRAAIAKALSCHPEILILDEATTGLDVIIEAEVLRVIKELQKRRKMGIIIISHDSRLMNALCDRSLKIEDGVIVDHNDYVQTKVASNRVVAYEQ